MCTKRSARNATCKPELCTSTLPRLAPKRISPSAELKTQATAIANQAKPPSTSTPSGRRFTSTTPTASSAPKSTTPNKTKRETKMFERKKARASVADDAPHALAERSRAMLEGEPMTSDCRRDALRQGAGRDALFARGVFDGAELLLDGGLMKVELLQKIGGETSAKLRLRNYFRVLSGGFLMHGGFGIAGGGEVGLQVVQRIARGS